MEEILLYLLLRNDIISKNVWCSAECIISDVFKLHYHYR